MQLNKPVLGQTASVASHSSPKSNRPLIEVKNAFEE